MEPNVIIKLVCDHFKVNPEMLITRSRLSEYCLPRQVAMYLLNKNTKLSSGKIGSLFNRDHATVLHSITAIRNYIETDRFMRSEIKTLNAQIPSLQIISKWGYTKNEMRVLIGLEPQIL